MAEEQVVVTPERGSDLGGGNEFSDKHLGAAELLRRTQSIDVIDLGASRNACKVIEVVGVALLDSGRELPFWLSSETQLVREVNIVLISAFLGVLGKIRETHRLNPVSGRGEAGLKRLKSGVRWLGDMVAEIIGEEIQAVLSVNRVHSGEVSRVDTISK